MMWRRISVSIVALIYSFVAWSQSDKTTPTTNDGIRWRIGYYESGPLSTYQTTLRVTLQGLMELGWIEPQMFPKIDNPLDTKELWDWAATELQSDYIELVPSAFWSANWDASQREDLQESLLSLFQTAAPVDLIITMGTEASLDFVQMDQAVPILSMESPDPLKFGIVQSIEFSGQDNVFAVMLPNRYRDQLELFYEIYEFDSMGIIFEDSENGQIMSAYEDVQSTALGLGFKVKICHAQNDVRYLSNAKSDVYDCVLELAEEGVEGVYLTQQRGLTTDNVGDLVNILHTNGIPSFSQQGAELVKYGVLLTLEPYSRKELGAFYASVIAQNFNGVPLGEIPLKKEFRARVVMNIGVSERFDFEIPFDIRSIADTIYRTILRP